MLYDGADDLVDPQFKANTQFIPGLIEYIKKTPVDKLEGSSFILLTKVFDVQKHKDKVDGDFIKHMLDSLNYLKR
jgi:hypothetical protein